jgi:hypothetical protein
MWPYKLNFRRAETCPRRVEDRSGDPKTRSGDPKRRPGRSRDPLQGLRGWPPATLNPLSGNSQSRSSDAEARSADAENLTRPRRDNVRANRDPIPATAGEFPTTEIWRGVRRMAPSLVHDLDLVVEHLAR